MIVSNITERYLSWSDTEFGLDNEFDDPENDETKLWLNKYEATVNKHVITKASTGEINLGINSSYTTWYMATICGRKIIPSIPSNKNLESIVRMRMEVSFTGSASDSLFSMCGNLSSVTGTTPNRVIAPSYYVGYNVAAGTFSISGGGTTHSSITVSAGIPLNVKTLVDITVYLVVGAKTYLRATLVIGNTIVAATPWVTDSGDLFNDIFTYGFRPFLGNTLAYSGMAIHSLVLTKTGAY